ncbi:MAG: F0F1 ATP synthase subunit gamma [Acidimicrobiia bacterium]
MAGGQERILKRRIRSVQSTKKITRAMELIAASRIVKAQARVHAARPYSDQITEVIHHLAQGGAGVSSPLLKPRDEIRKVAYVVLTADRGLCGAYNSTVIRLAERSLKAQQDAGRDYSLILVGKKADGYFRFRKYRIDATFSGMSDQPTYEDARTVAQAVLAPFEAGDVDQVQLVYTRFLSAGLQEVAEVTLMPLDPGGLGISAAPTAEAVADAAESAAHDGPSASYEFEPGADEILTRLLPRYVEARIFAAQLDAAASEHAARQRAMKAATDNADELIKSLTRVMNRARQEQITTEIMEIVGGAEALRGGGALVNTDLLSDTIEARHEDLFPSRSDG